MARPLVTISAPAMFLIAAVLSISTANHAAAQKRSTSRTQVVLLGTGNPSANPDRMGPSVAIIVNGSSYLVDAGTGLVRRAAAASKLGVKGLTMPSLKTAFITHLHSDHTIGLPDLIFTPWILHRSAPLELYGPPGLKAMTDHILAAWSEDNAVRIDGLERANGTGDQVNVHEVTPGMIYKDSNVEVTAFSVRHGMWWPKAYGYRFKTADRVIVVSGDLSPSESIPEQCNGCDVLLHEVYSEYGYAQSDSAWKAYARAFHTSTGELAKIATSAKPKLLVLYHQMYFGGAKDTDAALLREIRKSYSGKVASAKDLDIY